MIRSSFILRLRKKTLCAVIGSVLLNVSAPLMADDGITSLGIPAGKDFSVAVGVSDDGSVVVGFADNSGSSAAEAFYWSADTGYVNLGFLPGTTESVAWDISGDGTTIIGESGTKAFRWTLAGGMQDLGSLGAGYTEALGVNADGGVVVGISSGDAFRWTQAGGMVAILPSVSWSRAYAVNDDGTVIVGDYHHNPPGSENMAFIWTQASGKTDLGNFGGDNSFAFDVSADGSIVVGTADTPTETHAFKWASGTGLVDLGVLSAGDNNSGASAISRDGKVIVGTSGNVDTEIYKAFRWTNATGMQSIVDWLESTGVEVGSVNPTSAGDTNSDGSVIVGVLDELVYEEGAVAFIARAGSGLMSVDDISESLASTSEGIGATLRKSDALINGAHSQPMSRRVPEGKKAFWVAGDLGTDNHKSRDGSFGLAEVGYGYNYGLVQVNVSLGKTYADQNLILNGDVDADGTYVMLEGIVPLKGDHNLFATLGAYGHWGEADIKRGYLNAGLPDFSSASPDTQTWAVRARLDWVDAFQAGGAHFTPYADLSYTDIEMDGYTETGGGFPAMFDQRSEDITELRIGLNGHMPLENTQLDLVGGVEAIHRFDDDGARTSGELVGLFAFDLNGQDYKSTWYKAGIGLQGQLGVGKASLILNGTTEGEMPNAWLAASYQVQF
ncbi:MAG: autotransporter domain-containing protein [Neptuniibacter sp.]